MTRADIRIETAKRRAKAAEAALSKAYAAKRAAIEATTKKHLPAVWAAKRKAHEARQAVAVAELAALGITPMKTIILWHPKYTGSTAQKRYAVNVTRDGWKEFLQVGKDGAIMGNRNPVMAPYSARDWERVVVTDEEVRG